MTKAIRFGVAYYPEQWGRERLRTDAAMMADLGLSLVRLGEFAWYALEPAPGEFRMEWLDEAIEVLAGEGLQVVLGTPTAAPPAWLVEAHPEILPLGDDGHRAGFGHRRHYCPNQPAFVAATERVVTEMARRYGGDRRVIGWQIDNEFGGRCHCETCRSAFAGWLRARYGSLDILNREWGTAFWSQTYSRWEQVPVPDREPRAPNPALALDYRRFVSDSYVDYQRLQAQIIRSQSEGQFVTHNLMGFKFPEIDYGKLARDLDMVTWDNYPGFNRGTPWTSAALSADAMWGLKGGPVWVMEQQVGPIGWQSLLSPRPGQVRLWTYQALAHGAEAILFFRWRTARFGTEQHWHGILDADGRPGARYRQVRQVIEEIGGLQEALQGSAPRVEVALLHDYDSRFALQVQPTNPALAYEASVERHYRRLRRLGLGVAVLTTDAQLAGYRLVVAPDLYLMSSDMAERLAAYVDSGGVLVLAPRTAAKDRTNAAPERPLPAWLDSLAGVRVCDCQSDPDGGAVAIIGDDATPAGEFAGWYEELELDGARAAARYADGPFAGGAAIAVRNHGRGRVLYLAGVATEPTLEQFYRGLAGELGLGRLDLPESIETVEVESESGPLLFVLNHAERAQRISLGDRRWQDLLSGRKGLAEMELEPYGVAVLRAIAVVTVQAVGR
jgi:beta-galactosidase